MSSHQQMSEQIKQLELKLRKRDQDIERIRTQLASHKEQLKRYKDAYGSLIPLLTPQEVSPYDRDKGFFEQLQQIKGRLPNSHQIAAIRYPLDQHIRIIAGAGCGKTETLCAKVAYLITMEQVEESRIWLIGFTAKEVEEMKKRVHSLLGVDQSSIVFGTFTDLANLLIQKLKQEFPLLLAEEFQHSKRAEEEYRELLEELIKKYQLQMLDREGDKRIAERIAYWRNQLFSVDEMVEAIGKHYDHVESEHVTSPMSKRFRFMMTELGHLQKILHIYTEQDYLLRLHQLVEQSLEVRKYIQGLFDYMVVDEFQDITPLQMALMKSICPPDHMTSPKLIIAGDDDQSTSNSMGSDPNYLKEFDHIYRAKTFGLMLNSRLKYNILVASNRLISCNKHDRIEKAMEPSHKQNGDAYILVAEDAQGEAQWISDQVIKLGKQGSSAQNRQTEEPNYTSSVVLYRSISQLHPLISILTQKGIPYQFTNPNDVFGIFCFPSFKRIFEGWQELFSSHERSQEDWKKILGETAYQYEIGLDSIQTFLSTLPSQTKYHQFFDSYTLFLRNQQKTTVDMGWICNYLQDIYKMYTKRNIDMKTLFFYIRKFPKLKRELTKFEMNWLQSECMENDTWKKFYGYYLHLHEQRNKMNQQLKPDLQEHNVLRLLSIDESKGLAYDHVFVIGAYDGGIPHVQARPFNQMRLREAQEKAETFITKEDERRRMYIAVTRARQNLYITVPDKQNGKLIPRSPFLAELRLPVKKMNRSV